MTQRTRYFMFGSALVILVSLCTGLVAYYSGNLPLRASSVGPAELAYVSSDATAVAYLRSNCLCPAQDDAALTAQWQAAQSRLSTAAPNAGTPKITPLPPAGQVHAAAVRQACALVQSSLR